MKKLATIFVGLLTASVSLCQQRDIDSLKQLLSQTDNDSLKVIYCCGLSDIYADFLPDTAIYFAQIGLDISTENESLKGQTRCLTRIGNIYSAVGEFARALEKHIASLKLSEEINDQVGIAASYNNIAEVYKEQQDYQNALNYYGRADSIFTRVIRGLERKLSDSTDKTASEKIKDYNGYRGIILMNKGDLFERMNSLDSALLYGRKALQLASANGDDNIIGAILSNIGVVHSRLDTIEKQQSHLDSAISNFQKSIPYLEAEV